MDVLISRPGSSVCIFETLSGDPHLTAMRAIDTVEGILTRYRFSGSGTERTALLLEIESLRRFALVRRTLAKALSRPGRIDPRPVGRQLCETLLAMVGDVPNLVQACLLHGACHIGVETRQAIACLNLIASLDASFL
ncbi:hypothetical protein [Aestuariivirga sp.]|uniref:hypothetical protein n=1 Tax=Aestuariivirga sp. TaxID=2650926 RepID=UPI00391CD689